MLHDYLKDSKYDNADENLRKETKNVSNTNNIGKNQKPNRNMKTFETIIKS